MSSYSQAELITEYKFHTIFNNICEHFVVFCIRITYNLYLNSLTNFIYLLRLSHVSISKSFVDKILVYQHTELFS